MKTLYSKETLEECTERIQNLTVDTKPLWGKMNATQMLEHCTIGMETFRDMRTIKRGLPGILFGGMMKAAFFNEKPFKQGLPTAKEFIISNPGDFETAQKTLITHLEAIQQGGIANCTKKPHAFFGKLTPEQWGMGMFKHLDHHLQQFGV